MFFYSSCSESQSSSDEGLKKQIVSHYRIADGELFSYRGQGESYLDTYIGDDPKNLLKEIKFEDLPEIIKEKEIERVKIFKERFKNNQQIQKLIKYQRFFRLPNGRIAMTTILKNHQSIHPDKLGEEISFMKMGITPVFPGCAERDSDCFIIKLQEHFDANFNTNITKGLSLRTGKEKINLEFNIDLNGNVADLKVRAPREIIKDEATRVMNSLPKMKPGKKYGKPIKAKYILPVTFLVL
jgi:hypothetical protein